MVKPPFEVIWKRIVEHEGEPFRKKRGDPFTYTIDGFKLFPIVEDRIVNRRIHKTNIEHAYHVVPVETTTALPKGTQGPSYVWAILHDNRIRLSDW